MAVLFSMCGGIQYQDHKIYFYQFDASKIVDYALNELTTKNLVM